MRISAAERVGAVSTAGSTVRCFSQLARWNAATANRVDRFVANSQHFAAGRIRRTIIGELRSLSACCTDFFSLAAIHPKSTF